MLLSTATTGTFLTSMEKVIKHLLKHPLPPHPSHKQILLHLIRFLNSAIVPEILGALFS